MCNVVSVEQIDTTWRREDEGKRKRDVERCVRDDDDDRDEEM